VIVVDVVGAEHAVCVLADGDCLMLAQALNLPTSVKLARTRSVDLRLFARPPRLPPTNVSTAIVAALFLNNNNRHYKLFLHNNNAVSFHNTMVTE